MLTRRAVRRALCALPLTLVATATALPARAAVVDDTPAVSWQVNGPVYATAVVGDTVYVGGRFTEIVSSTGDTKPRGRLAAFSISTGKPLDWNPKADGVVWALEATSSAVWAGGEFTSVDGRKADHIVRLAAKNGEVDKRFDAGVNNTVRALKIGNGMLYVGGTFTKVGKLCQKYLTKMNPVSGAVPKGFDPRLEDMVRDIAVPPAGHGNDVYVAGNFYQVNGKDQRKIALINGANGDLKPIAFEKPATTRALDISPDGSVLFGGIGGDINSAVAWSTETGKRLWRHRVVGDVHEVTYYQGTVWTGFAEGALDNAKARVQVLDATTGEADPAFAPAVNSLWGVRTIAVSGAGVVVAGNFWKVNGAPQKYLAIFR